jgi:hypothetical protein
MRTILIAHRDTAFAEELATELRAWGYRVIDCPGPLPPTARCIRCDTGYCPLSDGADLMIYDPCLTALDPAGATYNLALESAKAQPDVPMLLAWPASVPPDVRTLRMLGAVPSVRIGSRDPAALRIQVSELLAAAPVAP